MFSVKKLLALVSVEVLLESCNITGTLFYKLGIRHNVIINSFVVDQRILNLNFQIFALVNTEAHLV